MFSSLFKNFLLAVGFLLVGFGVGMIMAKNFQIEENYYWLITISSLILGGFFTALGVVKKTKSKEKNIEETRKPVEPDLLQEEESFKEEENN